MRLALLAIAAALAVGAGCKKKKKKIPDSRESSIEIVRIDAAPRDPHKRQVFVISQVSIETADRGEELEIYEEELAKQLGRQLTETEYFAAAETALPPDRVPVAAAVHLVITYDVVEGTESGTSLVATIEARLRPTDGTWMRPLAENVLFERPLAPSDLERVGAIVVDLMSQGTSAIGNALINQARLREATDAELISTIANDGSDRAWAISVAGDRRLASAVDVISDAYGSDDPAISDAALTALVAIGDPAAVPALTDGVDFKDYDQVRAVVEAVGTLGGEEATAFLEFVASGHADPEIAERAREALDRLSRHRDAAPDD